MEGEQPREEGVYDTYLTAQHIAVRRAMAERGRLLRGGYSRTRSHLRVLRQQLDEVLFAPPLPAPDAPVPLPDAEEIIHFFHDMHHNLHAAILAATGLARDLPPDRRERYLRALCCALTNLTEDLHVLAPVEAHTPLPARPALTLVPVEG